MEVSSFLVSGLMGQVPMLKTLSPDSWARILPLLRPARFERGEVVCAQGDASTEMFIVLDGFLNGETFVANEIMEQLEDGGEGGGQFLVLAAGGGGGGTETKAEDTPRGSVRKRPSMPGAAGGEGGESEGEGKGAGGRGRGGRKKPEESRVIYRDSGVQFLRRVAPGDTVNVLAVIKVWDLCVETITAEEPVQCYAITAEAFFALFRDDDDTLREMRERTVDIMFQVRRRCRPRARAPLRRGWVRGHSF